ncbi:MAG: GNAT family N-acetyltransferase [Tateyamaria sp.]|jgi:GNAT superfamily N-acetyltransferase|uniref:GNAT family N-acetyltransferase n=1 Tax=Tateyamaria sp. TaxID=1929288 RepID=UPI0032DCECAF
MASFRDATAADLPDILALMTDDVLGAGREGPDLAHYMSAFERLQSETDNHLIVGVHDGRIIATYQLTFISGLSLQAARRAQIETVRVASDLRGQKIGEAMIADAEARARAAGCALMQLTMNKSRTDTARFYQRLGFTPSHIGYKRDLI